MKRTLIADYMLRGVRTAAGTQVDLTQTEFDHAVAAQVVEEDEKRDSDAAARFAEQKKKDEAAVKLKATTATSAAQAEGDSADRTRRLARRHAAVPNAAKNDPKGTSTAGETRAADVGEANSPRERMKGKPRKTTRKSAKRKK